MNSLKCRNRYRFSICYNAFFSDTIKGGLGLFGAKTAIRNKATVFTVGNRTNIVTGDLEAPIIVPHVAQQNNQKVELPYFADQLLILLCSTF